MRRRPDLCTDEHGVTCLRSDFSYRPADMPREFCAFCSDHRVWEECDVCEPCRSLGPEEFADEPGAWERLKALIAAEDGRAA